MGLLRTIWKDLQRKAEWRYQSVSRRAVLKVFLADGSLAMVLYRLMQFCHRNYLGPVGLVLGKVNVLLGGCVIGRGADFGPGFVLLHSLGTVINSGARGGRGVLLEH